MRAPTTTVIIIATASPGVATPMEAMMTTVSPGTIRPMRTLVSSITAIPATTVRVTGSIVWTVSSSQSRR